MVRSLETRTREELRYSRQRQTTFNLLPEQEKSNKTTILAWHRGCFERELMEGSEETSITVSVGGTVAVNSSGKRSMCCPGKAGIVFLRPAYLSLKFQEERGQP